MIKRIPAADKRISSTVLNVNASIGYKCRFYDCKSTYFFGSFNLQGKYERVNDFRRKVIS